ncbi:MAG TPA: cyclic nucleotide-binding domain-containing protein, partial [Alphaproteobacteria bacterium]
INEGDVADHAYIIQSGMVEIFKDKKGKPVKLARLEAGDIFGETSLLFDEPRMASAKAVTDCNLIIITRQVMEEKLRDSDATIRAIVKMMKERIKHSNVDRVEKTTTSVADIHKVFHQAFQVVMESLSEGERKNFRHEASPILQQFLDVAQMYIDRSKKTDIPIEPMVD